MGSTGLGVRLGREFVRDLPVQPLRISLLPEDLVTARILGYLGVGEIVMN